MNKWKIDKDLKEQTVEEPVVQEVEQEVPQEESYETWVEAASADIAAVCIRFKKSKNNILNDIADNLSTINKE